MSIRWTCRHPISRVRSGWRLWGCPKGFSLKRYRDLVQLHKCRSNSSHRCRKRNLPRPQSSKRSLELTPTLTNNPHQRLRWEDSSEWCQTWQVYLTRSVDTYMEPLRKSQNPRYISSLANRADPIWTSHKNSQQRKKFWLIFSVRATNNTSQMNLKMTSGKSLKINRLIRWTKTCCLEVMTKRNIKRRGLTLKIFPIRKIKTFRKFINLQARRKPSVFLMTMTI